AKFSIQPELAGIVGSGKPGNDRHRRARQRLRIPGPERLPDPGAESEAIPFHLAIRSRLSLCVAGGRPARCRAGHPARRNQACESLARWPTTCPGQLEFVSPHRELTGWPLQDWLRTCGRFVERFPRSCRYIDRPDRPRRRRNRTGLVWLPCPWG